LTSREFKSVKDALLWAASYLQKKGVENSRLEAEVLFSKVLEVDRGKLLASLKDPLGEEQLERFKFFVAERIRGYPLQYITHEQEFMSLNFYVEEGVFIPRGDTEVLVEAVMSLEKKFEKILDVGTGSGIIAVTLAKIFPESRITALDVSEKALENASLNAEKHGVRDRIIFIKGDIFFWQPKEFFDLVVSNPPYIPSGDILKLQKEISFEPIKALDGGPDGLKFYYRLAELCSACLHPGGVLAVEIGWNQAREVRKIFYDAGIFENEIKVLKDYGGRDRVVICRRKL